MSSVITIYFSKCKLPCILRLHTFQFEIFLFKNVLKLPHTFRVVQDEFGFEIMIREYWFNHSFQDLKLPLQNTLRPGSKCQVRKVVFKNERLLALPTTSFHEKVFLGRDTNWAYTTWNVLSQLLGKTHPFYTTAFKGLLWCWCGGASARPLWE